MRKIYTFKKSSYLLLAIVTLLPVMTLSARGGFGGDRGSIDDARFRDYSTPYERGFDERRNFYRDDYGGYGGYGGYSGYSNYVDPYNAGQPGMSDDSSALYESYLQSNPPQSW